MFRNLEAFYSFKNHNIPLKEVIFDSNIYTFNNYSYEYYKSMGASLQTAPYELNLKELKGLAAPDIEMNIYGYIPLMTTAGCMYCGFGVHLEPEGCNRYQKLKETHPAQYSYFINNFGDLMIEFEINVA